MTTLSTAAAPMAPRGFMAKAGTFAAGTALAGAAIFGGATVAPTISSSLAASVQHDFLLTADTAPMVTDFVTSLQNLLDTLGFGNMGEVLGLFSTDSVDITTASTLATLLSTLNPEGATLESITGGFLSQDLTALLDGVQIGGASLGSIPIDDLLGDFIGGDGANTSIGDLLTQLGFGPYVGLLNLPMLDLSPTDTVGDLLNDLLGITSTTSLNDLLTDNGLGDATIATMLGIDPDQPWDEVISNITVGGTIMDPDGTGILGDETLGDLLTSLLGTDADPVTDTTTLTDFLGDLGLFDMLGV